MAQSERNWLLLLFFVQPAQEAKAENKVSGCTYLRGVRKQSLRCSVFFSVLIIIDLRILKIVYVSVVSL